MCQFTVGVVLYLSSPSFDPFSIPELSSRASSVWIRGDLMTGFIAKKHVDNGMGFQLLAQEENHGWLESVLPALIELCVLIKACGSRLSGVVPSVSIEVETDGENYPALFLTAEFIAQLHGIGAEIDIDVIACL